MDYFVVLVCVVVCVLFWCVCWFVVSCISSTGVDVEDGLPCDLSSRELGLLASCDASTCDTVSGVPEVAEVSEQVGECVSEQRFYLDFDMLRVYPACIWFSDGDEMGYLSEAIPEEDCLQDEDEKLTAGEARSWVAENCPTGLAKFDEVVGARSKLPDASRRHSSRSFEKAEQRYRPLAEDTQIELAKKVVAESPEKPEKQSEPVPRKGWTYCDYESGEQWLSTIGHKWVDGQNRAASTHRRRVVMTEPPSVEAVGDDALAWVVWRDNRPDHNDFSGVSIRSWWNDDKGAPYVPIAWCHKLPGETEPPKMLIDWKPATSEPVDDSDSQPDTSLAASIERMDRGSIYNQDRVLEYREGLVNPQDDFNRIIEAVKEVDELRKQRDEAIEVAAKSKPSVSYESVDKAAKACMKYVQDSLRHAESYGGTIWPCVDGWSPFRTAILKALEDSVSVERNLVLPVKGKSPALGVPPKYIHDDIRRDEILQAIDRYREANHIVPAQWYDELAELARAEAANLNGGRNATDV